MVVQRRPERPLAHQPRQPAVPVVRAAVRQNPAAVEQRRRRPTRIGLARQLIGIIVRVVFGGGPVVFRKPVSDRIVRVRIIASRRPGAGFLRKLAGVVVGGANGVSAALALAGEDPRGVPGVAVVRQDRVAAVLVGDPRDPAAVAVVAASNR